MCEIFGLSAKKPVEINAWLTELYSHSVKFPNGWGLAVIDGNEVNIEKEPVQAVSSVYLKNRLSQPIVTSCALAHIRHAVPESMQYCNCHPFTRKGVSGRRWTIAHNGAIFEFAPLEPYKKLQNGITDTERILMYLVDRMNQAEAAAGRRFDAEERFAMLDEMVCDMSEGNRLNMLIFDGEYLYAHTNKKDDLFYRQTENYTVVATKPLDDQLWQPVPFTTLIAFKDGKTVFTGTNHGKEFIETEEHLRILGFR
ncbi:MAG: class II glutamine amidotransferase [Lachnospiraceae bacterium]